MITKRLLYLYFTFYLFFNEDVLNVYKIAGNNTFVKITISIISEFRCRRKISMLNNWNLITFDIIALMSIKIAFSVDHFNIYIQLIKQFAVVKWVNKKNYYLWAKIIMCTHLNIEKGEREKEKRMTFEMKVFVWSFTIVNLL